MKTLALLAAIGILGTWLLSGCADRERANCDTQPTAPRCQ